MVCKGSGVGKMCYMSLAQAHIARQIQAIIPFTPNITIEFLRIAIECRLNEITSQANGVIPGIAREATLHFLLPVPPLKEQNRIVEKIKRIDPLVSKYSKCEQELEYINSSISSFLRKSILQKAIQGRLAEQSETDEPASVLLERIKAEKEKLVKAGLLKKSALQDTVIFKGDDNKYWEKRGKEVVCIDDEIPFDLPNGWVWTRVKSILHVWSARRVHEKDWRKSGIPFYRAREIARLAEYDQVQNELFIDKSLYDDFSSSGVPDAGDIMMTAVGTLGKVYIVKPGEVFYFKDGSVLCLSNPFNLNSEYLKMVIESPAFVNQYIGESQGTTVATLTMVRVNEYLIPLPPLAEQSRIVDAINNAWQVL